MGVTSPLGAQNSVNQTASLLLSRQFYLALFKDLFLRPLDTYSNDTLEPAAIQNL